MKMTKTYLELIQLDSYDERFEYLKIGGFVGEETFGSDRYLNQALYTSPEWRKFRNRIIVRDNGCEMGLDNLKINKRVIIHHINPITPEDIVNRDPKIFDPNNVVCVSHALHQAIHYGDKNLLPVMPVERTPHDTCPWKK